MNGEEGCAQGEPGLSSFCLSRLPVSPSWAVHTAPEKEQKREYMCVHTENISSKPQQRKLRLGPESSGYKRLIKFY